MYPFLVVLLGLVLGVIAPADTLRESAPAPLLVPGSPPPPDSLRQNDESQARDFYRQGRELEATGSPAAAIVSYRLALRHDPDIPDANYRIGKLFLRVDQIGEAAAAFAAELERHPGHQAAARELGLALARLGQSERAIAQLELLTRRVPADAESWRALGYAYSSAGRLADAETALRRAVALRPPNAAAHRDLGFVLGATGRGDEARAEYRRALAIDPGESGAWLNLGNLDRRQGELGRALEEYRAAEQADSTLGAALLGQAAVLMEQDRKLEAGAVYRRLLSRTPDNLEVRFAAVRIYTALGRGDIALEVARDGVRYASASADAHLILGMALQTQGSRRDAARELHRAEALAPDSVGRARARGLLEALNRQAPDSLRTIFAADSTALARARSGGSATRRSAAPAAPPRPVTAVPPERMDSLFVPVPPDSR